MYSTQMDKRTVFNVWIGWTGESALAYEVCKASLIANASINLNVQPLRHWELRNAQLYRRPYTVTAAGQRIDGIDNTPFSTDFSFTRFLVPALEEFADKWVLYCDNDMLWLDDVAKLVDDVSWHMWAIACVKHDHAPAAAKKMVGYAQTSYRRKNWSSLMMMNPKRCAYLSVEQVNKASGAWLHGLEFVSDYQIGTLDPRWNVLYGLQDHPDPAVVHFTNGTPDMPFAALNGSPYERIWRACAGRVA